MRVKVRSTKPMSGWGSHTSTSSSGGEISFTVEASGNGLPTVTPMPAAISALSSTIVLRCAPPVFASAWSAGVTKPSGPHTCAIRFGSTRWRNTSVP